MHVCIYLTEGDAFSRNTVEDVLIIFQNHRFSKLWAKHGWPS